MFCNFIPSLVLTQIHSIVTYVNSSLIKEIKVFLPLMQTLRKLLGSGPLVKGPHPSARITPRHAIELGSGIQKDADEKI